MNGLSLRVSSVKTSDNVRKNAEMRAALGKLPAQYENSNEWFCLAFQASKTVPEQVACVKKIFLKVTEDVQVLQFLCDLFVCCSLKHPVRNQIVKLLISINKSDNETLHNLPLLTTLENSLRHLLIGIENGKESCNHWNTAIASISGCFENFDDGLKALSRCIDQLFPIICKSVDKYINELSSITSPSLRNEYYLYIHNSIRVLLSCIQEFGISLKETQIACLQELNTRCRQIVLDIDIPMDPRTNAGILMAYLAKLNNEYNNFVLYAKSIENPQEIAICVGVINTCDPNEFILYSSALLDICKKINDIANGNATVPNILLCATRALYQISKILLNFNLTTKETLKNVEEILDELINFSVAFMEHHMDSVRHLCRDIMRNVLANAKKRNFLNLMIKIYEACNSEQLSLAVKCIILQQAANVLGAEEVISNCDKIFTHLFAKNLGKDFIVNNLYEALMLASYKEKTFENWYAIWISYLLNIASVKDCRLTEIECLIVKAVKCDVRVVQTIIFNETHEQQIPISTKLSTLWAVRKSGIKIENFSELMEKFSTHLKLSLISNDDDTRIMALRLLVETNKTTEPLTKFECEQFLIYMQYNSNCQSPATRQKSLAMLTKALNRCQIGLAKQLKGNVCNGVNEKSPLELMFLKDFIKILTENLFEGANFSRRSVSLQLLYHCVNIGMECNINLMTLLPSTALYALLATLKDSFESNKQMALNILKTLEKQLENQSLIDCYQLNINLNEIQSLLTSVKPTDSVTASYHLEFLCHRGNAKQFVNCKVPLNSPCLYAALKWLLKELEQGLALAELSILEAAKLNPLYGQLYAVNHLLKNLNFSLIAEELQWRELVADLIGICKQLTFVVAPIVNSSSPEGHLPNDFSELPEGLSKEKSSSPDFSSQAPCKILSSKLNIIDMSSVKTTPQMVLICAWRTVKEVSLILGDIVLFSDIQFNDNTKNFLITKMQILEIGEHFKLLLSETKHRGAFEQAYVGFSKLCCRLWTVKSEDLNVLPMIWLKELMNLISQEDLNNGKICATRRSAGVPFMVQALITSELKVGTTKALRFCMNHLLYLCNSHTSTSESRTHSLNILRALFRCTDLNEAVGEYVSEGVMAAIRGYDANNWSEKNSSTLLFAALITRIFGVQRTKDSENLNIRNRMTGRVFFLRYPKLYDFFLEELQLASELIGEQQKANKLHPLLLILSRLYPSALEGTESNLKLSVFIPYISKCGGCPEMQTRYLAGKAIVALVNKDEVAELIRSKCVDMVVFFLIRHNISALNIQLVRDITSTVVTLHQRTQLKNAVILKVMLDIFIEILSSSTAAKIEALALQQLTYFGALKTLNSPSMAFYYTVVYKSIFIYNLYVMHLTLPTMESLSDYLIEFALYEKPLEELETHLNIVLYILAKDKYSSSPDTINSFDNTLNELKEEFEILPDELKFVDLLAEDHLQQLSLCLRQSISLYNSLKHIINMKQFYPAIAMKSYAILSFLNKMDLTLHELIVKSKLQSDDVKSAITMCIERILQTQGLNYDNALECLEYLKEIGQSIQPYCLRFKAAHCLAHLTQHYSTTIKKHSMQFLQLFINLILELLMDDDCDIREFLAKLVINCLNKDLNLSLNEQHLILIPQHTEGVVSTVAQRIFLQYTAEHLYSSDKENDDFILDVFKIITNQYGEHKQHNIENTYSPMDVEIFDKNEANVFAEPLWIVKDAVEVFKLTFNKRPKVVQYLNDYMENLKKRELLY